MGTSYRIEGNDAWSRYVVDVPLHVSLLLGSRILCQLRGVYEFAAPETRLSGYEVPDHGEYVQDISLMVADGFCPDLPRGD